jgi:hypothetical protein
MNPPRCPRCLGLIRGNLYEDKPILKLNDGYVFVSIGSVDDVARLRRRKQDGAGWIPVGVVPEVLPLLIAGLNVWDHKWVKLRDPVLQLPHPSYPSQRHRMWTYEITHGGKIVRFAAGELSAGVWGFYVPE